MTHGQAWQCFPIKMMFMTNKLYILFILIWVSASCAAVPVQRGRWITITLPDGTEVRAEARGDERLHYWQTARGERYLQNSTTGLFEPWDDDAVQQKLQSKRVRMFGARRRFAPATRAGNGANTLYSGLKKSLIILVQFADSKFKSATPVELFRSIANERGYGGNGFKGSVKDYFLEQSDGRFELDFDIAGPITMPYNYAYFGNNDDQMVGKLVHDACVAVDDSVDFSRYDWDHDGEVEQVYVLYSGQGQNNYPNNDKYIWPHKASLQAYDYYLGNPLVLDKTVIDTYACSNELTPSGSYGGIGTICHEFSHCLGLPDMYDVDYGGQFGMGHWDLMDAGSYNDDGFTPSGYSGYERMVCGWRQPVVLSHDTRIDNVKALSEGGNSYILYHPSSDTEYYILENRQLSGFDADLPGSGLLVHHIDYDEQAWENNYVNAVGIEPYSGYMNTHQRATIIHADNDDGSDTEWGDTYPYNGKDSLCRRSLPSTVVYQATPSGKKLMDLGIFDIAEDADGHISFAVRTDTAGVLGGNGMLTITGDTIFSETFDLCVGSGGNDGKFNGSVATAYFLPDNSGWSDYTFAYGGRQCARFGKSAAGTGMATTPWFELPGDTVTLRFRAAGWNTTTDGTNLLLSLNGNSAVFTDNYNSDRMVSLVKGQWTTYELKIVGQGMASITFVPSKRFFLDDVVIVRSVPTAISSSPRLREDFRATPMIYTIDGRRVGTRLDTLPPGVYIVNGRKVLK